MKLSNIVHSIFWKLSIIEKLVLVQMIGYYDVIIWAESNRYIKKLQMIWSNRWVQLDPINLHDRKLDRSRLEETDPATMKTVSMEDRGWMHWSLMNPSSRELLNPLK